MFFLSYFFFAFLPPARLGEEILHQKHQKEEIHTKKAHNKKIEIFLLRLLFLLFHGDEAIIKRKTQESKSFSFFRGASIFLDTKR